MFSASDAVVFLVPQDSESAHFARPVILIGSMKTDRNRIKKGKNKMFLNLTILSNRMFLTVKLMAEPT